MRIGTLTLLFMFLVSTGASAATLSVSIDPPAPSTADNVRVVVSGTLDRGPVQVHNVSVVPTGPFSFDVQSELLPGGNGGSFPFSFSADLGSLPPGNYTVLYEQSVFDFFIGGYLFNASRSLALTVASIVPTVTPNALVTTALLLLVVGAAHLRWSRRQRRS